MQNFKTKRSLLATLSVKFKREVPRAREVVGPLTDMHLFATNAASEQQLRSPQVPHWGMSRTEARLGDITEGLVRLRHTRTRRCNAGSSATTSTRGGAQTAKHDFQPSPPHTNTQHAPELLCTFYLTYEWFVSHRVYADIDDYTLMQHSSFLYSTRRSSRRTGGLAAVGGVDGGRG